jgi:hypothetical protein
MSRQWAPKKQTVELDPAARPSRIRREPPPATGKLEAIARKVDWDSREWEVRFAVAGVASFAIALCILAVAFAGYTGWSPSQYSVTVRSAE